MRSMEKGDNEDDSDVLPLLEPASPCLPFDLITQPVLQRDKQDSHLSLSLWQEDLTIRLPSKQKLELSNMTDSKWQVQFKQNTQLY